MAYQGRYVDTATCYHSTYLPDSIQCILHNSSLLSVPLCVAICHLFTCAIVLLHYRYANMSFVETDQVVLQTVEYFFNGRSALEAYHRGCTQWHCTNASWLAQLYCASLHTPCNSLTCSRHLWHLLCSYTWETPWEPGSTCLQSWGGIEECAIKIPYRGNITTHTVSTRRMTTCTNYLPSRLSIA